MISLLKKSLRAKLANTIFDYLNDIIKFYVYSNEKLIKYFAITLSKVFAAPAQQATRGNRALEAGGQHGQKCSRSSIFHSRAHTQQGGQSNPSAPSPPMPKFIRSSF